MASIPLANGQSVLVDDADYEMLSHWKWSVAGRGYPIRGQYKQGKTRTVYMHRQLLLPDPGVEIDHINGDILDNRRENLRPASRQQNSSNQIPRVRSSRYKGVSRWLDTGRWQAHIKSDYETTRIGYFKDEVDAALAYDVAALRLFGEFARPNFLQIERRIERNQPTEA